MLNFTKHFYLCAVLNGLINALLLNLALDFSLSTYTENMALEWSFVISAVCAGIGILAFLMLLPPAQGYAKIIAFITLSVFSFLLAFLLFFCLPSPFPLRTTNNADGLLLMFLSLNYGVIAALGRVIIIISMTIKNHYEKN